MRARLFLLAAVATGCGFHAGGASSGGGDGGSNGSGDAPTIDAPIPGDDAPAIDAPPPPPDAPADTDGDGVADATDDCPTVADPHQHDYDGDGTGDACDPCPQFSHVTYPGADDDDDHDGVGNMCDPRAGTDARKLWDAFYPDDTTFGTWVLGSTTWTLNSGKLKQTSTTAFTAAAVAPGPIGRAHVVAQFTIKGIGTITGGDNGIPFVGVSTGNDTDQFYACSISPPLGGGTTSFITGESKWQQGGNHDIKNPQFWAGSFDVNISTVIAENTTDNQNKCAAAQGTTGSAANVTATIGDPTGSVALYTNKTAVDWDYVFVVELGGP